MTVRILAFLNLSSIPKGHASKTQTGCSNVSISDLSKNASLTWQFRKIFTERANLIATAQYKYQTLTSGHLVTLTLVRERCFDRCLYEHCVPRQEFAGSK